MDPITAAILAAIAAGAAAGLGDAAKQAVADAYAGLKGLIVRKFGAQSELAKAVEGVQAKPDSEARQGVLKEEVASAKAELDPELVKAALALLEKLQAQPGGPSVAQTAIGSYIAQATGGGTASVNVNTPKS